MIEPSSRCAREATARRSDTSERARASQAFWPSHVAYTTGVDPRIDRFDRIAARYDRANHILSLGLDGWWRAKAIHALAPLPGQTILDLCCGTGALAHSIVAMCPGSRVVGLDQSEAMLKLAKHKAQRVAPEDRPLFLLGDALATPFLPGAFASLICGFGLRSLPDRRAAFREVQRVAQPGGRAVFLEFTPPKTGWRGGPPALWIRYVVPRVGSWITADAEAHRWLADSVRGFPRPATLAAEMNEAGLAVDSVSTLFPGVVSIWRVTCPM